MADSAPTIYIAGAGIAGLTLALALARLELNVVVLERAISPRSDGAGLQISPNARRVLDRLGLGEALDKTGFEPQGIDLYPFRRPTPLVTLTLGDTIHKKFGAAYCVMHRADLAEALLDACKRFANIDIRFGIRNFDLVTHARGLSVSVEQFSGDGHTARPHAFVGADGVHSLTRTKILAGPKSNYSGFVAWRTMLPLGPLKSVLNTTNTSLFWGPDFHLIAYPHPGRDQLNVAMFTREKLNDPTSIQTHASPTPPKMLFKSKHFEAILELAKENWTMWPLNAVSTGCWTRGPVGLVGDAAHAMLPFQAQGAAMAIEDAAVLAPLLASAVNAEDAFARYQLLRQKRVERVAAISARNGDIYHMEWPFTLARNIVVGAQGPIAHFERLGWIYGYDPASEIDAAPVSP